MLQTLEPADVAGAWKFGSFGTPAQIAPLYTCLPPVVASATPLGPQHISAIVTVFEVPSVTSAKRMQVLGPNMPVQTLGMLPAVMPPMGLWSYNAPKTAT